MRSTTASILITLATINQASILKKRSLPCNNFYSRCPTSWNFGSFQAPSSCPGGARPVSACGGSFYPCPQRPQPTFCYTAPNSRSAQCCPISSPASQLVIGYPFTYKQFPKMVYNGITTNYIQRSAYGYPASGYSVTVGPPAPAFAPYPAPNPAVAYGAPPPPPFGGDLTAVVRSQINSHPIIMYTKTDCKYCIWAKKFMQENGISYHAIDIYVTPNGWNILATVQRMTGQRSVPQLFVCGWFIGGYNELVSHHKSGYLRTLLSQCSPGAG